MGRLAISRRDSPLLFSLRDSISASFTGRTMIFRAVTRNLPFVSRGITVPRSTGEEKERKRGTVHSSFAEEANGLRIANACWSLRSAFRVSSIDDRRNGWTSVAAKISRSRGWIAELGSSSLRLYVATYVYIDTGYIDGHVRMQSLDIFFLPTYPLYPRHYRRIIY